MKRILLFCLLGWSLAGTAGCDDAENSALSNLLYLAEAEKSDAYGCNTSIIRSGHQIYVTARMSSKLDHPVTVDVDVDEALIDRHNAEFDETLQLLPESNWTFLDDEGSPVPGRHCEITIPAGQSSASVPIRLLLPAEERALHLPAGLRDSGVHHQGQPRHRMALGEQRFPRHEHMDGRVPFHAQPHDQ